MAFGLMPSAQDRCKRLAEGAAILKQQPVELWASALQHSLALPFLQVRIKPLQGAQELCCPQSTARHRHYPSCKRNSFRVQRKSCKRLVIPQSALKIYVLSPTQAAGDVYWTPVSAELREQWCGYNTHVLRNALWILISPRLISRTAHQTKPNQTTTQIQTIWGVDPEASLAFLSCLATAALSFINCICSSHKPHLIWGQGEA